MKKLFTVLISVGLSVSTYAVEFKAESYTEVAATTIKTMPQDYNNKKVQTTFTFRKIMASPIPDFIEKQFDERRYMVLLSTPNEWGLPIVVKKSGDLGGIVVGMQQGSTIKVYGRVKKFRSKPKGPKGHEIGGKAPEYYLELANIEVEAPTGGAGIGHGKDLKQKLINQKRRRQF